MAGTYRVALLGKTGSGKSSLANTIFGDNQTFTVNDSPNSGTSDFFAVTRRVHGRTLTLIDSPGLFDTDPDSSAFTSKIERFLELCASGPHAILLVLKVEKYTPQEQAVVQLILQYFTSQTLKYTTVVFTHGDSLPSGMEVTDWAQQNPALRDLLEKCGNRVHVVDNRYWGNQREIYRNNQNQVQDLVNTIELTVVANGYSCFPINFHQNPSVFQRFREAPGLIQIAVVLGVAVVGCLLYTFIPWAQISEWVVKGVKYGEDWIWQNLPIEENIKKAVVHLVSLYKIYQKMQKSVRETVVGSSDSFCTIL